MITVRFFAMLRNKTGCEFKEYRILKPITVAELKKMLKADFPALSGMLDSRSLLISVNLEFAGMDTMIKDGDEVGLLPPFSGG
ncbi:MAG: MoaD/ThiS family protein [Deltaproteobacteria bacterium]|nr:MoaD/ThiS family protein [Deltaproteobacteria bacterium]